MTFKNKIKNRFNANKYGKQAFSIPSLNRKTFAIDQKHCESKFLKHKVFPLSKFKTWIFILIGR